MTILDRPRASPAPGAARASWRVPLLLALAASLVRLPFMSMPLAPDEGGYLLVASQWRHGSSTYGNYFVDRPPLLIGLFGLADSLGGATALRLIGVVAVSASVLLAAAIGRTWAAVAAAVFLSTPLFGTTTVDGELLAVPFVLGGVLLVIRSARAQTTTAARSSAFGAGACAAGAILVKQNMADVLVFAAVVLIPVGVHRGRREIAGRAASFVVGGGLVIVAALLVASTRGTSPPALWDSLVTFRAQAAVVINAYANSATPDRLHLLLLSLLASGAPLVVLASLLAGRRAADGVHLRWAGAAMLAWELAGAALGGSYWLHYLIAVVPGVVVLVAATLTSYTDAPADDPGARRTRWVKGAVAMSAASAVVSVVGLCLHPPGTGPDQEVSSYVREHSAAGDTMVVAFGAPNIVHDAGLGSPYPHLWSLSVRVRDPSLSELVAVLEGPRSPRWVVVSGESLATWGVDEVHGQRVLDRYYVQVIVAGDWHLYERR